MASSTSLGGVCHHSGRLLVRIGAGLVCTARVQVVHTKPATIRTCGRPEWWHTPPREVQDATTGRHKKRTDSDDNRPPNIFKGNR